MGLFQKQIEESEDWHSRGFKYVASDDVMKIVVSAKKEFPNPEEIQMQLARLVNFLPDNDIVKGLRRHLEKEYKATWKWFSE